jgi:acyl-CoA thioester hydrolase
MRPQLDTPPIGATASRLDHRVNFFETDAMGIVHHANYLRFFEMVRVEWLEEHDQPYSAYMAAEMHFATTRSEVDYIRSARFGDELTVSCWLDWVRGASLQMSYVIVLGEAAVATGLTEHAAVNLEGRVRRLPVERRKHLAALALEKL